MVHVWQGGRGSSAFDLFCVLRLRGTCGCDSRHSASDSEYSFVVVSLPAGNQPPLHCFPRVSKPTLFIGPITRYPRSSSASPPMSQTEPVTSPTHDCSASPPLVLASQLCIHRTETDSYERFRPQNSTITKCIEATQTRPNKSEQDWKRMRSTDLSTLTPPYHKLPPPPPFTVPKCPHRESVFPHRNHQVQAHQQHLPQPPPVGLHRIRHPRRHTLEQGRETEGQ